MNNRYELLARRSRSLVLVSLALLLAVFTVNTLIVPSCDRQPNTVVWVLHMLPVLLFLPGVLRQNVRSHVWLALILLGYFMAAVATAFGCASLLTVAELALLVILFISAMLYIRWRSRQVKALADADSQP